MKHLLVLMLMVVSWSAFAADVGVTGPVGVTSSSTTCITTDLTQAIADLKAEVTEIGAAMDVQFLALQKAQKSGSQPAIAKATANIKASIGTLKATVTR